MSMNMPRKQGMPEEVWHAWLEDECPDPKDWERAVGTRCFLNWKYDRKTDSWNKRDPNSKVAKQIAEINKDAEHARGYRYLIYQAFIGSM
jgi:hypothetical protein